MDKCQKCGRSVENSLFCRVCGEPLSVAEASTERRTSEAAPAEASRPLPAAAPKAARRTQPQIVALLVILVVGGIGSLMLLASATRSSEAPHAAASPSIDTRTAPAADQDAPTAYAEARSGVARPYWTATTALRRVGGHGIMFELAADEEVQIWRKRVRPVLSVRCVGRAAEVFVMTHSPANIEGNTRLHSVKLSIDNGEPAAQMWEHSVDHDALFAPDGRALTRRLAGARHMAFTFTPFNAPPAVANFTVDGLGARLAAAGKSCS